MEIRVKQSKMMVTLACIAGLVGALFFLGLFIYLLLEIVNVNYKSDDDYEVLIFCCSGIGLMMLFFIGAVIYLIYRRFVQVDIYTEEKLVRKYKETIIFELNYKDIVSLREGFFSLFLFCNAPIIQANGKKGPRTIYEHYSLKDIARIKQLISPKIQR